LKISYTKPETNKILTSSSERIPECNFVLLFRGTIYTRKNLRGIGRVKVAPRGDVFVRNETFKFNTYSPGKNKTTTRTNKSNMSHQVETKMI
jgi:hypothetical protein